MNILLTSVGRRSYIVDYFKSALNGIGKVVAANSMFTSSLNHADKAYVSPLIYDDNYIPFLLDVCRNENIRALVSLFDIDLVVLAQNRSRFEEVGTEFVGPSLDTAIIGNDKLKTVEFFASADLRAPQTYLSPIQALAAIKQSRLTFPLVVKPRWGMGSIGVYFANNANELQVFFEKCVSDIKNSYLKFESGANLQQAVVIQEFLEGQEYGLDIFKDLAGNFVSVVAKKKVSMRSGETDVGEVVAPEPFSQFAKEVANRLSFSGIISVDCFLCDGNVYGNEINSRISGHYPFSHLAGVRYPEQLVAWLQGRETDFSLFHARVGTIGCKELNPVQLWDRLEPR